MSVAADLASLAAAPPPPLPVPSRESLAATWEAVAPLDDEEEAAVAAVTAALAECSGGVTAADAGADAARAPAQPPPPSTSTPSADAADPSKSASTSIAALDSAVLSNVAEFDRWWAAVQAARAAEAEGAHTAHAAALAARADAVGRLAGAAGEAEALLDRLVSAHAAVAARAAALTGKAGELVAARERAAGRGAALKARLAAFDELDAVTAALAAAEPVGVTSSSQAPSTTSPAALDDAGLVAALGRAADALAALAARPHYADAAPHAARLRAALARGAALVRARAGAVLAAAAESAGSGGGPGAPPPSTAASGDDEVSNLRFRSVAEPGLAALLAGVGARAGVSDATSAGAAEFAALLADVRASYCGARLAAAAPRVRARVDAAAASTAGRPADLAAAGAAALAGVAAQEVALYRAVFAPALEAAGTPVTDADAASHLAPLIDPLATLLYDALRPAVVRLAAVDDLVDVVAALKASAAGGGEDASGPAPTPAAAAARAAAADALRPVLARAVADAQERLAFRVQAYVKEQVLGYVPVDEDLAYPDLLKGGEGEKSAGGGGDGGGGGGADTAAPPPQPPPTHNLSPSKWTLPASASLYPPCARAADVLDATAGALAPSVFAGLAQDAVCGAAAAVGAAAPTVARRASPADGHLFAVRSLMGLRSRLAALGGPDMTAPPDTDVQFDLDFAHVRDQMLSLVLGAGSDSARSAGGVGPSPGASIPPTPFTAGSTPRSATSLRAASSALAASLAPRTGRRRVDGARELDAALRGAAEAAIMAATRAVADPLLSLITKATAAKVAATLAAAGNAATTAAGRRLRDHAFAAPDRVAAAVSAAGEAARTELPRFAAKAALYIPDAGARAALLRPIKANLAEAYAQVASLVEAEYEAGAEADSLGLPSPEQLGEWLAVLDA